MQLTKSSYIAGIQCVKQLWLRANRPDLLREASAAQRRMVQQGRKIGELARQEIGSGRLVDGHGEYAAAETRCLIDSGSAKIFEAAFVADSIFVRCDVLARSDENRWTLIEVKSSTTVKPHHIHDLAIQYHVVSKCGLAIDRMILMHVDKSQAVGRDRRPMFVHKDVTAQVHALAAETRDNLALMHAVFQSPTAPEIDVGARLPFTIPMPIS